jgi:hypothetical protein
MKPASFSPREVSSADTVNSKISAALDLKLKLMAFTAFLFSVPEMFLPVIATFRLRPA